MISNNLKALLLLLFVCLLFLSSLGIQAHENPVNYKLIRSNSFNYIDSNIELNRSTNKSHVLFEDFENDAPNWSEVDETVGTAYWHSDTTHAYEGKSWWMGDPEVGPNGGYLNEWYQVLDTPEIELPANGALALSFKLFRAYEPPEDYNNFDGWDGFNIRIRNAGESYRESEILTDVVPSYNCSSLYSFGYIHGEDPDGVPGIPGWGGASNNWENVTFNIPSSYQDETVIISFAFASDGAACTEAQSDTQEDHPAWTGVLIDNINVADVFTNDAEDTTGFNAYTPTGGQLWHIYEADNAPSPTHAMGCFNEDSGTYNPFMDDFVITPEVDLPRNADIWWDTHIKVELDDPTNFPDCDYLKVQVRYKEQNEWQEWNSISNPTGSPGGDNYVFTGEAPDWTLFSQNFPGYNDMTELAGKTVQFRLGLITNRDNPTTFGVRLDNFYVQAIPHYNPPHSFAATFNTETRSIDLDWEIPYGIVPQDLIYFVQDSLYGYINDAQPYAVKATNPYDYPVPLSNVNFMLYNNQEPPVIQGTADVIVWENDNGTPGDTLLHITEVDEIPHYSFKQVDVLEQGVIIPPNESFFVGINNFETDSQGILADSTTNQCHSYCFAMGQWQTVAQAYGGALNNITITATIQKRTPDTSPLSYNVFRSQNINEIDNLIANVSDTKFSDGNLEIGQYFYNISALYEDGESKTTEAKWGFVELPTAEELYYDNGVPEQGFSSGNSLDKMAVKITSSPNTARLLRLKYFITEVSSDIILQLWDDSGKAGMPGNKILHEPIRIDQSELLEDDWNIINIPGTENIILEPNENLFIGLVEVLDNSKVGLDDDLPAANRSYVYKEGEWSQLSQGNLMMRAIVDTLPSLQADFISNKSWGTVPFQVEFTDLSRPISDSITSWLWNFGDGATDTLQNPIHQFDSVGVYNVSLIVESSSGNSDTLQSEDFINAYPPVWSGDTNSDGIVDTLDLDQIAIFMNSSGAPRDDITFAWQRNQYPGDWSDQDAALADCNGDGIVNLADLLAIGVNWQKEHTPVPGSTLPPLNNPQEFRNNFLKIYNSLDNVDDSVILQQYLENILSLPHSGINSIINCFPNPFNPTRSSLTINYQLKENAEKAEISIYNLKGQLVRNYDLESSSAVSQTLRWDGKDKRNERVSSGIYLYKFMVDNKVQAVKKLILIR